MNQKLTLYPASEPSDDVAVPSDDAVRQALLRMGSGKQRSGATGGQGHAHGQQDRQSGFGPGGGGQRRGGDQLQAASTSPDARRRRFSQNEHVPVEYVSRDRQNRNEPLRLDAGHANAEPSEDRTGFLERELERERLARAAVERGAEETRAALTAARTRIAHLEIDLQEARAQRQAMIDLAHSAAQQSAAQQAAQNAAQNAVQHASGVRAATAPATALSETGISGEADDPFAPARRGRGRPRRTPLPSDGESEPEPVKWWSDD